MPKTFTPSEKRRDPVSFEIAPDDYTYEFTPHKVANVMLPVLDYEETDEETGDGAELTMTQRTWDWLKAGLADGDYDRIRERLDDPDDDLDVGDVAEVTRWLLGKATGRPTGRRRG